MSEPITLVLGGIGVKGVASIGVLQSLQNHRIRIKKIIAAGISSLVSAQFALGTDLNLLTDEFTRFFKENNRSLWGLEQLTGLLMSRRRRVVGSFSYFLRERLYCQANLKSDSTLSWDLIEPQIARFFGNKTFSDLKIPLAVSTIDLKRGRRVLLDEGKLYDSMKASIAFPGLLPPVVVGNMELISSTIYCELPLDSIKKRDAPVVTIDLPSTFYAPYWKLLLSLMTFAVGLSKKNY
jgi:NTE family protein